MNAEHSYHQGVPDNKAFELERDDWRSSLAQDEGLHARAVDLMRDADEHRFGYQWAWCGVPIIRWPDDIVLTQEIVWDLRPACIIETGIARGGSVVMSASLMAMSGLEPAVLGLDILIYPHARQAISSSPWSGRITVWEGDSASTEARNTVEGFLADHPGPALLVLDSDHTHEHVLAELRSLAPLMPVGGVVMVADTVIDDMPADYYPDREWGPGNNPASAVREFLKEDDRFQRAAEWSRRGLLSEMRDGVIRRVRS